ncbi:MAG: DUF433 domain-containing protein [Chloroflexi bacterium]|nr:DUF433 domain-containing protein [Chloroflexota bacterium]
MASLREQEAFIAGLSRAEKTQVLQWVARDLGGAFSGIESAPEVSGGETRIVRTRIPVWVLVPSRRFGISRHHCLRR